MVSGAADGKTDEAYGPMVGEEGFFFGASGSATFAVTSQMYVRRELGVVRFMGNRARAVGECWREVKIFRDGCRR